MCNENKIEMDEPLSNTNATFNFEFTPLNRLFINDEGTGTWCDVIAKVYWRGTEEETQNGISFKNILLEDESSKGKNKAIQCKLWGGHRKAVKKKGDVVVIYNASIQFDFDDGKKLVVNVNQQTALFVISNDEDGWMLSDAEKETHRSLLSKIKPLKECHDETQYEGSPRKKSRRSSEADQNLPSTSSSVSNGSTGSPKKLNPKGEFTTFSILELKQLSGGMKRGPINCLIKGVRITQCNLRRYVGCSFCSKKLQLPEHGEQFCQGIKCQRKKGEKAEKKILFLLKNITITDGSEEMNGLVCFNEGVQNILNKHANEYVSDENAEDDFRRLKECNVFDIKLTASRKGPQGPNLSQQPWGFVINQMVIAESTEVPSNGSGLLPVFSDDVNLSNEEQKIQQLLAERKELVINVTTSPGFAERITTENEGQDHYQITSKPRGLAILIAIEITIHHDESRELRNGSKEDIRMFTELFEKLHFKVILLKDITSIELADKLDECRQAYEENDYDSCLVGISSHGLNNMVQLSDGVLVNLWRDIIYRFDNKSLPSLIGKPKIFLLGFCQDYVEPRALAELASSNRIHHQERVGPNCDPSHTDMCVFISNSPGFKSYRSPQVGTHFFRAVAEVFMQHAHNTELKQLFKSVSRILYTPVENTTKKHVPVEISLLFNKDFYFNP